MREVLKGWKRKAGLVTLAMACVFAAAWLRSNTILDVVDFPFIRHSSNLLTSDYLDSVDGVLIWGRTYVDPEGQEVILNGRCLPEWATAPSIDLNNPVRKWRWRCCGFGVFDNKGKTKWGSVVAKNRSVVLTIPYWSIVLPLTLLSIWLLLSKPRPAKKPVPTSRPESDHA